jgi:hypothetical protein
MAAVTACLQPSPATTDQIARPGQTPAPNHSSARHPELYAPVFDRLAVVDRSTFPYSTISLERTFCLGHCPTYKVVYQRDGTARLSVVADCELEPGEYVGVIHARDYGRICCALDDIPFDAFESRYAGLWSDDATCIISATRNGSDSSVSDYGAVGPIELWMLQEAIDAVTRRLKWQKAK